MWKKEKTLNYQIVKSQSEQELFCSLCTAETLSPKGASVELDLLKSAYLFSNLFFSVFSFYLHFLRKEKPSVWIFLLLLLWADSDLIRRWHPCLSDVQLHQIRKPEGVKWRGRKRFSSWCVSRNHIWLAQVITLIAWSGASEGSRKWKVRRPQNPRRRLKYDSHHIASAVCSK